MSELRPYNLVLVRFAAFHCSRFVVGSFIYGSSTGGCIQLGLQGQTSVLGVGVNADSVAFDTFMSAMMAG